MDIHIPSSSNKKKKVAIFANGQNADNLYRFLDGLYQISDPNSVDYFLFMCHALYSHSASDIKSLCTIYDLPDLDTFDAAIMFTPGINFQDAIDKIVFNLKESGIPVISIGFEYPGFHCISVDNYVGMKELCEHLITKHNIKNVKFIAGPKENDDSNIRLKALKDTMAEHNLPFDEDNDIFYSNWELGVVLYYIYDLIDKNEPMPDAFICANDLLAETVTYAMEDRNFDNFASQCLTGFDYMHEYRAFYPSLASVDQQPDEAGRVAWKLLCDIFGKKNVPKETIVNCKFHPGESCGCFNTRNEDELRRMNARIAPRKYLESKIYDGLLSAIEKNIIHSSSYNNMVKNLQDFFYSSDGKEGNTFYLLLDKNVSKLASEDILTLPKYRFADEMDVVVAKNNSLPLSVKSIETSELVPMYSGVGANEMYMFIPIFYESFVCGYVVLTNGMYWLKAQKTYYLEDTLKSALISYRRNMQLEMLNEQLAALMEKDSLTSVKNRTAYDRFVNSIEKKIEANECCPFSIVCFDVNNLKTLNDRLGHESGDEYIKNCCKYICDSFKHSPVYRIGGDEFVAILQNDDYNNRHQLLEQMREGMNNMMHKLDKLRPTELVSIASGMSDYEPASTDKYSDVFRWADEKMYQNKFIMKNGHVR